MKRPSLSVLRSSCRKISLDGLNDRMVDLSGCAKAPDKVDVVEVLELDHFLEARTDLPVNFSISNLRAGDSGLGPGLGRPGLVPRGGHITACNLQVPAMAEGRLLTWSELHPTERDIH